MSEGDKEEIEAGLGSFWLTHYPDQGTFRIWWPYRARVGELVMDVIRAGHVGIRKPMAGMCRHQTAMRFTRLCWISQNLDDDGKRSILARGITFCFPVTLWLRPLPSNWTRN